jgi:epoxyqueuosine reductase
VRYAQLPEVAAARARRQEIIDRPLSEVARKQRIETPSRWVDLITEAGKSFGVDDVGVARMDPSWVFEGHRQDTRTWAIAIAVQHDYDALKTAPEYPAATEVVNQCRRALKVVKELTGWIRDQG